jgi:GT2 family glycosyltransferase
MNEPLTSVVIPVSGDAEFLGQCLDRLMRQGFERKEVIVVCDARTGELPFLPQDSEQLRVMRQPGRCSMGHLINRGMQAARGQVKIMLMPHCVPVGDGWMSQMVEPFANEKVGAAVGQCAEPGTRPGLPVRLLRAVVPGCESPSGAPARLDTVSHLCDAYLASLLADIGYFDETRLATPGEAVDVSVRIVEAGYSIVPANGALVTCNVPASHRRLSPALLKALDYGRSDAVLDRTHGLRWLNSGVFAAALCSLLLVPLAAASLPLALTFSAGLFIWAWFLGVRLPLLGWECPVAVLNFAAYVLIILLVRDGWWPGIFGDSMHPATIRQWCWLAAVLGTYLALLLKQGAWSALRAARAPGGALAALPVFALSMVWWLLAGAGHLRGLLVAIAGRKRQA